MYDLHTAYDAAYEAARNSLDGTFKLFEKVEEKAGLTSRKIIEAWQSQIEFFNEYNENLQVLHDLDLDATFLEKLSDGSVESAGQVKALKEELGNLSPEEAAAKIAEINDTFGELETAKDTVATTMAEMQTDFSNKLAEMEVALEAAINGMDMGPTAAEGARATMQAYIDQIEAMESSAVSAATSVATAVAAALNATPTVGGGRGYASGVLAAPPGLAWVGEDGPELINFKGGERVYNNNESMAMISGGGTPVSTAVPSGLLSDNNVAYMEKRITLDINGSGAIDIGSGADETTIVEIMAANIKPLLIAIIQQERFEEGDSSYEF